jgi:hypothetical protein
VLGDYTGYYYLRQILLSDASAGELLDVFEVTPFHILAVFIKRWNLDAFRKWDSLLPND